jgi:hypothetical protein
MLIRTGTLKPTRTDERRSAPPPINSSRPSIRKYEFRIAVTALRMANRSEFRWPGVVRVLLIIRISRIDFGRVDPVSSLRHDSGPGRR